MAKDIISNEKIIQIHQKAKQNLVEFFRVCLSDIDEYRAPAPFHFQISDILLHDNRHFAVEMFRESAKSTYVLKAYPVYRLTYPKKEERYIVIIKQNQELASAKLSEIINEYEHNDVLNKNLIKIHKRSAHAIELTVRGFNRENVQIRIEAYGKGSSIRGLSWGNLRPQVIIADDLQDLEDSQSETTLEKDWDWFLSDVKFLAKTGRIFLIGNNLGAKCIVERVIESTEMGFESMKISALDSKGESTWPEQFSTEFLKKEKEEFISLGKLDIWYRERMCKAIDPETQLFKREFFKFFTEEELPEKFDIDITIDPAISKKKKACNTAIVAVAKNTHKPDWYVLDYKAGQYTPYELISNTFDMYRELKRLYPFAFIRVYVEGVAYQEALRYVFDEEMKRAKIFMFLDTFVDKTDKIQRIKGLAPLFRIGVLHIRGWMIELIEEATLFPVGKTVDILDALSFHNHIKIGTSDEAPAEEKPKYADGNLSNLIHQLQETNDSNMIETTFLL